MSILPCGVCRGFLTAFKVEGSNQRVLPYGFRGIGMYMPSRRLRLACTRNSRFEAGPVHVWRAVAGRLHDRPRRHMRTTTRIGALSGT